MISNDPALWTIPQGRIFIAYKQDVQRVLNMSKSCPPEVLISRLVIYTRIGYTENRNAPLRKERP